MTRPASRRTVGLLGALTFVFTACGPPSPTIGELQGNPDRYLNQEIRIDGQSAGGTSVMGLGGYLVVDASGELIVATEGAIPPKGSPVSSVGRVVSLPVQLPGMPAIYLKEFERR